MAKRFTDTEMWDKEWFMNLSCKLKCLVKVVRDKADLCGVWSPNWTMATLYVGEKVNEDDLLTIDDGQQFIKLKNGRIFCIGFVEFQYGELSEKSPVHRKIIQLLTQNNLLENYKNIGCEYPINRVQEEEQVKEEEEDKEVPREKPFKTKPLPEDIPPLTAIQVGKIQEYIRLTKHVDVSTEQVVGLYPVFLLQNCTGNKYYKGADDVFSHYLNWTKTQKFEAAKEERRDQAHATPGTGGLAAIKAMEKKYNESIRKNTATG